MLSLKKLNVLILVTFILCIFVTSCNNKKEGAIVKEYNNLINNLEDFPMSYYYDENVKRGFGKDFKETSREETQIENGLKTKITLLNEETGIQFVLDTTLYPAYNSYEWTIYITNTSDKDSKRISKLNGADITFTGKDAVIKGINGDLGDMYAPYKEKLNNSTFTRQSTSGRPTHGNFPYFNLEYGKGGVFIAVGWPGCWRAEFKNKGNETRFTAGQLDLDTYLKPGETIRTPLYVFVKYEGRDHENVMNIWRKWFIDCNMKKVEGDNFPPVFAASSMSQGMNTNSMKRIVQSYINHDVKIDYLWMDAGWYTNASGGSCSWPETGSLNVDTERFPDRFAEISDLVESQGGKTLLWFEPEVIRLNKNEFLKYNTDFKEEWMLGVASPGTWLEGQLVDLGNEECRNWLLSKITKVIDEGKISMYRQDFNVDPAPVWIANDDIGRTGITENKYVQGYLHFFDALQEKYPNMMIDSCASGGGRNDIETMRRAVPLHVSDFWDGNNGGINERQATMQSLVQWIPYIKLEKNTGIETTVYNLRSCYAPWINANVNVMGKDTRWDIVSQARNEWDLISKFFYADYYELTKWNKSDAEWRGWQFFDEDTNSGYGQLFRPNSSEDSEYTIKLHGLKKNSTYHIKDFDGILDVTEKGSVLMDKGIKVTIEQGSSIVFLINKEN